VEWFGVLGLSLWLLLAACESVEDRAVNEYQECVAEHGLEGGGIGIVRGEEGGFAITAPDLPEPAASECLRRATSVLQAE
jgi:hypothetical protein